MKLRWLQLTKPCTIEIRPLVDYAGQPLVFRPPGLTRRCVTEDVFNHPSVQIYIKRNMLNDGHAPSVIKPEKARTVPTSKSPEVREPTAAPVSEPVTVIEATHSVQTPEPVPEITESVSVSEPVIENTELTPEPPADEAADVDDGEDDALPSPEPTEDTSSSPVRVKRRRR